MKNIMSKIYLKKDVDSINKKINMLGNTRIDAVTFISMRILSTILFALFLVLFTNISYMFIPLFVIIFYFEYYHIFITKRLRKREKKHFTFLKY